MYFCGQLKQEKKEIKKKIEFKNGTQQKERIKFNSILTTKNRTVVLTFSFIVLFIIILFAFLAIFLNHIILV